MTRTGIAGLVVISTSIRADIFLLRSTIATNVQRDDTYDDLLPATSNASSTCPSLY